MAMIKGKQIQSLSAVKIVETAEKKLVTEAQIAAFGAKAEVADVEAAKQEATTAIEGAKTEASTALASARTEITAEVATSKTGAVTEARAYTDAEAVKLDAAVKAVDAKVVVVEDKVTAVEGGLATGLEARYTKAEIDAKLSQLGAGIKYKGTVASFAEIATKFPTPEEGWLVVCESDHKFYIYDADTDTWENFPMDVKPCTTHTKTIRLVVKDNQTEIATGIKTNGVGDLQTSTQLVEEMIVVVNGVNQAKTVDFTIAVVEDEVKITWKSSDFALEASDVVAVTYNQIV